MVQDIRRITLSTDELIQALSAHRRTVEGFLPAGTIIGFDILNANSIDVILVPDGSSDKQHVVINDNLLVHALIRFCVENNIMLPRQGRKSVIIGQGSVSLSIALDVETYLMDDMEPLGLANYSMMM